MTHLIDKDALVAEIKRRIEAHKETLKNCDSNISEMVLKGSMNAYQSLLHFLDTLEVKEMDLEKEYDNEFFKDPIFSKLVNRNAGISIAKHFFELGLNASNPIAEENLESFVRQVIDLDIEAGEHYNNIIKEERKENGGSDLMIYLLCGTIDAKELGIQYVLDKLKTQKGEEKYEV